MILFFIYFQILPEKESFTYQTIDRGKTGEIEVISQKDNLGYHIIYTSDRFIEVVLDTLNLQTFYLRKVVNGKLDLTISRRNNFEVWFKGKKRLYKEDEPVYDRHTLDFVFRGFEYNKNFKKRIRLHVPELMIVNADIKVIGEEIISGPCGDIPCWEIKMTPRVIFMRTKYFFWIEKNYPHRFIKYMDSTGKNQILLIRYEVDSSR